MVNVDSPYTWIRYKDYLCENCVANCCIMPLEIGFDDLVLLELATEDDRCSIKKLTKRLTKEKIIKSYRSSTGFFMLEQKANRDCIFLDTNRLCKVYDKRPEVCRKFPNIGPRPGHCPYQKK